MGAMMSRLWFMMFPAKEYKIVVVGLDNAGKTTTLYKLHLGEVVTTHPTVGGNVEEITYKNIRFEVLQAGAVEQLPVLLEPGNEFLAELGQLILQKISLQIPNKYDIK